MKPILRKAALSLSTSTLLVLAACGGGGGGGTPATGGGGTELPATAPIKGVVADGLIQGAIVCYDLNDNGRCDDGEPVSTGTGIDGAYTIAVPAAEAGRHAVIAMVPPTAIDQDNPGVPVGTAFTLRSPAQADASKPVFVSPLTDAVVQLMKVAGTTDPAAAIAQIQQVLGLGISPLDNFIEKKASGTAAEQAAAQQAATFAQVITEVKKEVGRAAEGASVETEKKEALISVVLLNTINTLANTVAGSTATPASIGQQIVQSQGITTTTVAAQADTAAKLADATPDAGSSTPEPFITVRDLRYTNANNYSYRLFTGDDVADSDGYKYANEIRKRVTGGANVPFNRDTSYFDEAAGSWYECPSDGYRAVKTRNEANGVASLFCHTIASTARRSDESIAGSTVRSVLERIRSSGIGDYATWGVTPTFVASNVTFPTGSSLRYQVDTQTANPLSHSLTNKVRYLPDGYGPQDPINFNTWPYAAKLDKIISSYNGDFSGTIVTGNNADSLGDVPDATVTNPNYQKRAYYRVAFQSTSATAGNTRYYKCRRNDQAATGNTATAVCDLLNGGTYTIETRGDARVMRLQSLPSDVVAITAAERIYVERAGAVFYGTKAILQTTTSIRVNRQAWDALRTALGIAAHVEPAAPVAPDAAKWAREIRDLDNGVSYRLIVNTGVATGTTKEVRVTYNGNSIVPFSRNRLSFVGGAWVNMETLCPADGNNFGTWTTNPRTSSVCGGSIIESNSGFDADIGGKTFAAVTADARAYTSRDGASDFSNWGVTVNSGDSEYTTFTTGLFPNGSKLRYQVSTVISSADGIDTFSTFARNIIGGGTATMANLGELVSNHGGGFGGANVNGATTAQVFAYFPVGVMPAAPTLTGRKLVRVSFQSSSATGGSARFHLCDQLSATQGLTACITALDTTYTIAAQGDKNILSFAAMPAVVTDFGNFERLYAEHGGVVRLGSRSIVGSKSYTLRLNETAYLAYFGVFGITPETQTTTLP